MLTSVVPANAGVALGAETEPSVVESSEGTEDVNASENEEVQEAPLQEKEGETVETPDEGSGVVTGSNEESGPLTDSSVDKEQVSEEKTEEKEPKDAVVNETEYGVFCLRISGNDGTVCFYDEKDNRLFTAEVKGESYALEDSDGNTASVTKDSAVLKNDDGNTVYTGYSEDLSVNDAFLLLAPGEEAEDEIFKNISADDASLQITFPGKKDGKVKYVAETEEDSLISVTKTSGIHEQRKEAENRFEGNVEFLTDEENICEITFRAKEESGTEEQAEDTAQKEAVQEAPVEEPSEEQAAEDTSLQALEETEDKTEEEPERIDNGAVIPVEDVSEEKEEDKDNAEEEQKEEEREFFFSDDEVEIKALVTGTGALPADAVFECEKIDEKSEQYGKLRENLAAFYEVPDEELDIFPYDVRFVYEGKEVEPENGKVTLSFNLKDPIKVGRKDQVSVVHVKDDENTEVLSDDIVKWGVVDKFDVDLTSLSPVVITKLNAPAPALKSIRKTDENGNEYYISKTSNINESGVATALYPNNQNVTDKVSCDGAISLNVKITYGGERINYDWLLIKDASGNIIYTDANGKSVGYSGTNTNYRGKIGGNYPDFTQSKSGTKEPAGTLEYEFEMDELQFTWRTDGSAQGYGYYAVITPTYATEPVPDFHFEELEDGTYALVFDKGGDISAFCNRPDIKERIAPYKDKISEIRLHKGTTSIINGAFKNLPALKKVTVPRNPQLQTIGKNAFAGCDSLESFTVPSTVTSIDGTAFSGCTSLETVRFDPANAMTTLPDGLFKNCTALKNVTLPTGLAKIPNSLFDGCTALRDIDIPSGVTEIGNYAFRNTAITEVPPLDNISRIGSYAFNNCKGIKNVSIPANVTYIGTSAFAGCSSVTDFIFEDGTSFETLPAYMFDGMTNLTNVKLPDNLKRLPNYCFQNCKQLKTVQLPDSVTALGDYAFSGCSKLVDFEIPEQVKTLGPYLFRDCTSLKDMTIPKSVTSVGSGLFYGCTGLIRATFEEGSPVNSLPSSMFYNCSKLEQVKLPDGVTAIPASYFQGCTSLAHVDLPENLVTIGDSAFSGCYNLEDVELPGTLKTIGNAAFYNCDKFTSVFVPKSVTTIGYDVWRESGNIKEVIFEEGSPLKTLGTSLFRNCTSLEKLVLPTALTNIPNYLCNGCTKLHDVTIPENVTYIGQEAFRSCTSLKHINIPVKCKQLYTRAFQGAGLEEITLSPNATSIGDYALASTKIREVTIPNTVTSVGSYAFYDNQQLESVTFEEGGSNCSIASRAFYGCYALDDLTLKEKITSIGEYAFAYDRRLDEVVIPSTVTSISDGAFYNAAGVKKLEFPASASNASLTISTSTSGNVFSGLSKVEEIVIDRNITSSYKSTTNFDNINPDVKFTIGKHVDTLDNMIVSVFTDSTEISFEGENDFSVSTRVENTSQDVKWSELKGKFYVDPNGVVYKLNDSDSTASLFYIPKGITEYTVPAQVTSVAGKTYDVTKVDSHVGRSADDLTALVFEDPSNVTIPQFAFTGCESLQTINGKTELFPEEWTAVSTMCDFPVHSDIEHEQVTALLDTIELEPGSGDVENPRFSFGVSLTGQESMADDGLTYMFPTGRSARIDFAISNESNYDMSDRVIRVYFAFDGEYYTMGNYPPGRDFMLVNTATGAKYPMKVRETDAKGVYYYDITGFKPGDTLGFNNQFAYLSPNSGGGNMIVWVESISAEEAAEKEGKTSEPTKYIKAQWYTKPVPYNLTKTVNGSPTFQFAANQKDENDENIYVRNVSYKIDLKSSGASGTSYAQDFIEYVDFSDDLILPEGMQWSPKIIEAIRNDDYYVDGNNNIQAKVDGNWMQVCRLAVPNTAYQRSITCEVVEDENGHDAVRVNWSYKNSYWSDPKKSPTADMPATTYYFYLGDTSVQVVEDSELWEMLREGREFPAEEANAMRKIANKVNETTHYSFSEDQRNEARADDRLVYQTVGFSMTKEMTGVTTFGRDHSYRINLTNSGLAYKDDIGSVEDSLIEHYYIEPENMTAMFNDPKWGPYLKIDITSATLCQVPDKTAVDIYGNEIDGFTAQQLGADPIPHSGLATTDNSVITTSAKLSIEWNEARTAQILKVMDDSGAVQHTYIIGSEGDFQTIRQALDSIGYVVTYYAAYKVTWDLGDDYTLYNARRDGVSADSVDDLTEEQVKQYSYRLKSGRKDSFMILSDTKKTTMWLTADERHYYHNSSVYSNNTAYAKRQDGSNTGSANWSGYIYRDLSLTKGAYANGQSFSSSMKIPDDTVIDYTLSFTNTGSAYDVLPLTDKMSGTQVLLVPIRGNKDALYYPVGSENSIRLIEAGLSVYEDGGVQYFVLDRAGTYKGVTIDGRIADTIEVSRGTGTCTTLMTWYYQNVTGYSVNTTGGVTRSIVYKALADSSRLGGNTEDETGSSVTTRAMSNETWLGGHQTHRLYASLAGEIQQLQFSKRIVEDPEAARENLIGHSLVLDGDEVLYKIRIQNTADSESVLTGSHIHDELPSTAGVFPWSKDNVEEIYYVTDGLGSSIETIDPEYWYISSIQPGTGADTASRGLYYIYWNNDFKINFGPKSEAWIYVKLKFPGSDDIDEVTGASNGYWDRYIAKNNGAVIINTFCLDQRRSSVTHELVDVVEGKLQKGVLDTGLASSGYFQSEDTRHFYQNGGNVDNGSAQEVAYYTVIYNSGNVRLYLDPLQDQLPKGFKFRGLFNAIPKGVTNGAGISTTSSSYYNTLGSYTARTSISQLEYLANNSNYLPVATVTDENRNSIVYKNASISASTREDGEGHQQVTYTFGRHTNNDSYLKYDSSLSKYYLDPGEAVRFGYMCTVEGFARTENIATNEIAMPVYDKYGLGVRTSDEEEVTVTPAKYRDIAVNDGVCSQMTTEEEVNGKLHNKPTWAKNATEWFSSNVSLQRLSPVPGMMKTVGGETYLPSTTTIRPDQIYGSRYDSSSKGGTPYVGTVNRTSIVNWALRAYNEGGIGSNSMEDYWIVDTVDSPYQFTGNVFYDYYNVNGTKVTSSSIPVFSLGGRSEDDTTVMISTGQGSSTLTLDGTITVNGDPVSVDGGRAQVQLLRDNETKVETLRIRMKDNYHRIPPNSYMMMYVHTQYTSNDAVLSKQFYNHVQLEPSTDFDPALVSQGKVLYREDDEGDMVPYAIESGASVTMTAGYSSAARKQVTQMGATSNTGWSDKEKNSIELPEKFTKFYYDMYVDLPKDDPTSRLVMIDALPEPGDHSPFVDRDMRDSEFVVHMLSENLGLRVWSSPDLGAGTKKELTTDEYSFEVTTRTEFEAPDWDGHGNEWTMIDLSDGLSEAETALIESARSFRIIINDPDVVTDPVNAVMGRNYQVQVRFNAELAAPDEAAPGSIAWNSFGYRYTVPIGATGISTSLNAEPLKVGVSIPSVPRIIKDQKTPHGHYKNALSDTEYRFLIYTGSSIAALNDTSEMSMEDIESVLSANSRQVLISSLTIGEGEATGNTGYLDAEKVWVWNGSEYVPTETHWIWTHNAKYTIIELPFADNGYVFHDTRHSPVNNYTFTQNTETNVQVRVTNVYDRKGRLKVSKTVGGPSFDRERKFTFTIRLKDGKYPAYGTYSYVGTNIRDGEITFDDSGIAQIQLKHGQSIEIVDIPEGYTYTVTESADEWYSAQSTDAEGTIVANTTKEAAFVNTRKSTSLTVTKTVTGNFGDKTKIFDFDVYITDEGKELEGEYQLTVTHDDGSQTSSAVDFTEGAIVLHLRHGDSAAITGLPVGARYEVDELVASSVGYDVTSENESGVLTETGATTAWTNRRTGVLPTGTAKIPILFILVSMLCPIVLIAKRKLKK